MTTSSSSSSGLLPAWPSRCRDGGPTRPTKAFLGKHRIFVERFYKRLDVGFGGSETARKVIERLKKNRNTMFTFLDFDGVPWNNNNAEHAIKAYASLRRTIEGTTTETGL